MHGIHNCDSSQISPGHRSRGPTTRGHSMKLEKRDSKGCLRSNMLGYRVMNLWNSLPSTVSKGNLIDWVETVVSAKTWMVSSFDKAFEPRSVYRHLYLYGLLLLLLLPMMMMMMMMMMMTQVSLNDVGNPTWGLVTPLDYKRFEKPTSVYSSVLICQFPMSRIISLEPVSYSLLALKTYPKQQPRTSYSAISKPDPRLPSLLLCCDLRKSKWAVPTNKNI